MKFLKDWQGAWAMLIVGVVFFLVPRVFQFFDMNSGVIDPAYIHALVFTVGAFFTAVLCAWTAVQLDWQMLNRYIDNGSLVKDWYDMQPWKRVAFTFGMVAFLIAAFIACFFALPKP